jgi:hypothetical protein
VTSSMPAFIHLGRPLYGMKCPYGCVRTGECSANKQREGKNPGKKIISAGDKVSCRCLSKCVYHSIIPHVHIRVPEFRVTSVRARAQVAKFLCMVALSISQMEHTHTRRCARNQFHASHTHCEGMVYDAIFPKQSY